MRRMVNSLLSLQKKAGAAAKRGGKAVAASSKAAALQNGSAADKAANEMAAMRISDRTCTGVLCSHPLSRDICQIKGKAHRDGQKKNEETISSVATEILSNIDELKSKIEKDRQSFAKALSKSSKERESCLKNETAKFQDVYEKFCKERAAHLQVLKGKKEKVLISEQEKFCADKLLTWRSP